LFVLCPSSWHRSGGGSAIPLAPNLETSVLVQLRADQNHAGEHKNDSADNAADERIQKRRRVILLGEVENIWWERW